eukprot:8985069-Pyramimonas_sp.AAC.1
MTCAEHISESLTPPPTSSHPTYSLPLPPHPASGIRRGFHLLDPLRSGGRQVSVRRPNAAEAVVITSGKEADDVQQMTVVNVQGVLMVRSICHMFG